MMTIKKKYIFHAVLIGLLFLTTEILARAAFKIPGFSRKISEDWDSCRVSPLWRQAWVDGKVSSQRKEILHHSSYSEYHPTLGWKSIPDFNNPDEFNGRGVRINSKGVRGPTDIPYARTPGKKRILIIGDSFTFGVDVGDRETYPYFLQQLLPDTEVVNMGEPGYGHDQMLLYLKEEGAKYDPDIVMIGYLSMDDSRNLLSFRDYAKPYFILKNEELVLKGVPVPSPEETFKKEFWRLKVVDLFIILKNKVLKRLGGYRIEKQKITKAILHEIIDTIRDMGAVPVIVNIDAIRDNKVEQKKLLPEIKAFLNYWEGERQIPTISLLPYTEFYKLQHNGESLPGTCRIVQQGTERFSVRNYQHFSPMENRAIALGLRQYLIRLGLL
ncbi:MAG TPA: hypothetical protein P5160_03020 [Candidatus Omnitrophota bacterium]|nr:hypothetical protein [Candidatus Omnitrophota bacterium]